MLLDLSVCARAVPRGAELGSFVSSPSFVHSLFSFCSLFFFPPKKLHPQHQRTRARFLLTSTSEVYGDPLEHPQTESYWGNVNPIGERSCYDEGKRAAECLTFDYRREHGLDVRVCRIFNTYGPRMAADDGRVVSNFIVQALRGNDLTIYGQGQQTRSFCFVDDLIEGIIQFAAKSGDEVGPLNLGNDTEFTVLELANEVLRQIGGKSKIVYRPLPSDDPRCRRPDLTKAKALLDWTPRVQLADGLAKTIAYFRSVTPAKV